MSKPHNYWYGIVRKMAQRYKQLDCNIEQEQRFKCAIDIALEQIRHRADAAEQLTVIEAVLFDDRLTFQGAAMRVHVSEATAQRWVNVFINQVGVNAGYADARRNAQKSHKAAFNALDDNLYTETNKAAI